MACYPIGCLAALAPPFMLAFSPAVAQPVVLTNAVTNFAPNALGGIRTIIRYAVARPDRTEIDYLLLGGPTDDPVAIQVEGPHGDPVTVADVAGGDCTLTRTEILRTDQGVLLIRAERVDDVKHVLAGSLAQSGPMEIQVFRSRQGGDVGESSPVFSTEAEPTRKEHVCAQADVQRAMDEAANVVVRDKGRR